MTEEKSIEEIEEMIVEPSNIVVVGDETEEVVSQVKEALLDNMDSDAIGDLTVVSKENAASVLLEGKPADGPQLIEAADIPLPEILDILTSTDGFQYRVTYINSGKRRISVVPIKQTLTIDKDEFNAEDGW